MTLVVVKGVVIEPCRQRSAYDFGSFDTCPRISISKSRNSNQSDPKSVRELCARAATHAQVQTVHPMVSVPRDDDRVIHSIWEF